MLEETLKVIYDNEINCALSSFWDGGWGACIGDGVNGYKETCGGMYSMEEIALWLQEAAQRCYPNCTFVWATKL